MKKHNAALVYYIQSWQQVIHSIPFSANSQSWHNGSQSKMGNAMAMSALAWADQGEALRQYEIWQNQPRYQTEAPVIWREGGARLMDFGTHGRPIILVPSMINGHEIFNMPEPASLVEFLKSEGFHPFLLDWGRDDERDRGLGLADYQARLQNAVNQIGNCDLMAYCLGGTLSFAADIEGVERQVMLGVPWHFQHNQGRVAEFSKFLAEAPSEQIEAQMAQIETQYGVMPALFVDFLFAYLNPLQFVQKFRNRGEREDNTLFDALEDWLDSGRNMPIPLVREILLSWFREDFLVNNIRQNPIPTLAVFGTKDHIAPPKSCEAIANSGQNVEVLAYQGGHVGLLIGSRARSEIWPKIASFLKSCSK